MCKRDILFWLGTFCWAYDPRKIDGGMDPVGPFIPYPFQEGFIRTLKGNLGRRDIGTEKSRDMGASWLILLTFLHEWWFFPGRAFTVVSRNEKLVDATENSDSLFWKLDYTLKNHPPWMLPSFTRNKLLLSNDDTGSAITGESTTGNIGRGGRRTAIMLDEFAAFERADGYAALAATQSNTRCRILNSTPQGAGNAFYDMMQAPGIIKLRLHWSEHPEKRCGLYQATGDRLDLIDKPFWDEYYERYNAEYPFVRDGRLRSPWYDNECVRSGNIKSIIAAELDIEYLGSGSQFFDGEVTQRCKVDSMPAFHTGELEYDPETMQPIGFREHPKGRLRLWINYDSAGDLPADRRYAAGADISAGTGTSNSTLGVFDAKTGEKVAAFVDPSLSPDKFADVSVAICRWFKGSTGEGAYLVPESNGPGNTYIKRCVAIGYDNFYYRRHDTSLDQKASKIPGWYTNRDNKRTLLGEYARALGTGECVNRDIDSINECNYYVFLDDGGIGHSAAQRALDPSGAKDNHGDRVMADALGWLGARDLGCGKMPEKGGFAIPPNCLYARQRKSVPDEELVWAEGPAEEW